MSAAGRAEGMIDGLFSAIDAMDADRFVDYLTADAVFRFGSAPAASGRDSVREAVAGFFSSIAGLQHALTRTMDDDGVLVCEGEVTYTRHNGSKITLPFANVLELDDGLISHYKIYADITPLYDP